MVREETKEGSKEKVICFCCKKEVDEYVTIDNRIVCSKCDHRIEKEVSETVGLYKLKK